MVKYGPTTNLWEITILAKWVAKAVQVRSDCLKMMAHLFFVLAGAPTNRAVVAMVVYCTPTILYYTFALKE